MRSISTRRAVYLRVGARVKALSITRYLSNEAAKHLTEKIIMTYKVGQKVYTLDREQGYVHDIFADGSIDVALFESLEDTEYITVNYEQNAGVCIADNQIPHLRELTPIGCVKDTLTFSEGIIGVHVDNVKGYAGIWVSEERMAYLAGQLDLLCHHWVDIKDWDELFDIFDLAEDINGSIYSKGIQHRDIAEECTLEVMFADDNIEMWTAAVDGEGNIVEVTPDKDRRPEKITTLSELRATGAIDVSLVSRYELVGF